MNKTRLADFPVSVEGLLTLSLFLLGYSTQAGLRIQSQCSEWDVLQMQQHRMALPGGCKREVAQDARTFGYESDCGVNVSYAIRSTRVMWEICGGGAVMGTWRHGNEGLGTRGHKGWGDTEKRESSRRSGDDSVKKFQRNASVLVESHTDSDDIWWH